MTEFIKKINLSYKKSSYNIIIYELLGVLWLLSIIMPFGLNILIFSIILIKVILSKSKQFACLANIQICFIHDFIMKIINDFTYKRYLNNKVSHKVIFLLPKREEFKLKIPPPKLLFLK